MAKARRVLARSTYYSDEFLERVKAEYQGRFICEAMYGASSVDQRVHKWFGCPGLIFYADEPHPRGSNWFSVFTDISRTSFISNGIGATYSDFYAVEADNGDIVYPRFISTNAYSPDRSVYIILSETGVTRVRHLKDPRRDITDRVHVLRIFKDRLVNLTDPNAEICYEVHSD